MKSNEIFSRYEEIEKEYREDKRKVIPAEKYEDRDMFTQKTILAAEKTLNFSAIYTDEDGPVLASEAEALYVLRNSALPGDIEDFVESNIRPRVYQNPEVKYPQVPVHPRLVALIKELNAKSGVPHVTLSSTLNNLLDNWLSGKRGEVFAILAGNTGNASKR